MHAVTFALARYMTLAFYAGDRQPHTGWRFIKIKGDFGCPRELLNILCIKIWPHFFAPQTAFMLKPRLVNNSLRLGSNPFPSTLGLETTRFSETSLSPDVRESVHRDITMKVTNKLQLCKLIYYF